MWESGRWICNMAGARRHGGMAVCMRGSMWKGRKMERGYISMRMEGCMMEIGNRMK